MITILPVTTKKQLRLFIHFPWKIYKNDPHWVPPLIQERKDFLNPSKNPFFEHAEVALFLAFDEQGDVVGRISAQKDRLHLEKHHDGAGFFGLFECVNDTEVAHKLLHTAAGWLKEKGCQLIRGPFSFSINEESGLLIKGFECDPYLLMGHNPAYYEDLVSSFGFTKIKDLYCWAYDATRPVPDAPQQIAKMVSEYPGLTLRNIDKRHFEKDLGIIMEIFNEAWSQNWGFVPLTQNEIRKAAKDLKLFINPRMILIAEIDGEPAAICVSFPNINEVIKDLNGRLFPFGLLKLVYRIKTRKYRHHRLALLGVRKKYRSSVLGGLSVLLYSEIHRRCHEENVTGGELSWTLDDNDKINQGIEFMGGEKYKIYRIFQKTLS